MPFKSTAVIKCFSFSTIAASSLVATTNAFAVEDIPESKISDRTQVNQLELNYKLDNSTHKFISNKLPVLRATIDLIKHSEGFRSYSYIDTSGYPVIGYGQTTINGRTVRMGQYITQAQADAALEQELDRIQKMVQAYVRVELNPHQLGALTSLVYNAGTRTITNNTLARKLNAGDYTGASNEFVRWNKARSGGRLVVFPGLTKRRLAEQKLFLTPHQQIISNK